MQQAVPLLGYEHEANLVLLTYVNTMMAATVFDVESAPHYAILHPGHTVLFKLICQTGFFFSYLETNV